MTNWQRLLQLLHGIGFPEKYYGLYLKYERPDKSYTKKATPELKRALKAALAATGLKFRYFRSENFYRYHFTDDPRCDIKLHVSIIGSGSLELLFFVQFHGGPILGWHVGPLARWARELCEPERKFDRPPGNLDFNASEEKLANAIRESVELIIEVRDAILAETAWQIEEPQ